MSGRLGPLHRRKFHLRLLLALFYDFLRLVVELHILIDLRMFIVTLSTIAHIVLIGRGSAHGILINADQNEVEMQVVTLSHLAHVVQISEILVILVVCIILLRLAVRVILFLVRIIRIELIGLLPSGLTRLLFLLRVSRKLLESGRMPLLGALLDSKVFLGTKCSLIGSTEARMLTTSVGLHPADLLDTLVHVPGDVNLRIRFLD